MDKISKIDFHQWKDNKVTRAVFDTLALMRKEYEQHILNGAPGDPSQDTIFRMGEAIGRINSIDDLIMFPFDVIPPDWRTGDE